MLKLLRPNSSIQPGQGSVCLHLRFGRELTDAATGNKGNWLTLIPLCLITSLRVCRHLSLPLRSYRSITAPSTFLSTAHMRTCVRARQNVSAHKQVKINRCISHNCSHTSLSRGPTGTVCLAEKELKETFDVSKITSLSVICSRNSFVG